MRVLAFACLLLAAVASAEERKTYHGHSVLSVKATTEQQLSTLKTLHDTFREELLFMEYPGALNVALEIVVSPTVYEPIFGVLQQSGLQPEVISKDLGAEIDANMAENERNSRKAVLEGRMLSSGRTTAQHDFYRTLAQVNDLMLSWQNNPNFANIVSRKTLAFHSEHEGRTIYYLEVGTQTVNKSVIMIECLAHAREWITTASILHVIDTWLTGYVNNDSTARTLLDNFLFVIVPIVNPDGYAYTWSSNRLWRKNRRYIGPQCSGVDLNRNFDVKYGTTGTSTNCNSDIYQGQFAFSEAETQNLQRLFTYYKSRVVSYLSVHSYSQLLLYPWGYTESNFEPNPPSNLNDLRAVGQLMLNALEGSGRDYLLGTAYGVLGYAASGGSEDWALQEKGGIFAYCYELRPRTQGEGGFVIPASEIIPTATELRNSLVVLADQIIQRGP